ncbi:tetratricopeptide repeat-containing sensor histidine kinase [Mucilaginibacter sp. KACC 22063]|uniref:tetratricopeptide repeat-containing sensor histidine kinase n=1 Tax=Mucilaginibacter sp. KACC 22063 TaxID=3025666 RepID=UPI002365512B|nr:ATP-binding protein [Mucilaginibacter sp. KACC 22063]WDF54297.1 ATP-binding protein [Mucilaginibacter sp. KACC 22063]
MPYCKVVFTSLILLTVYIANAQKNTILPSGKTATPIERYNKLIGYYRYENPDSALMYVDSGLAYASAHKDMAAHALMLNQLGMINDNRGKFEVSRVNYLEAFNLYKSLNQVKGMASETIRLGVVEMRKGNYDKSVGYFLEALKYSESIKDSFGIMEANITLGEAYTGQRKYDIALKYLKIAEDINAKLPLSNLSLNLCNDFGIAYRELGMLEEAKSYFEKGIEKSNVTQYQGLNITLTNNLATVYAKDGNAAYSIKLQKAALKKAIKIHNYIRELQTLNGLAQSYQNINIDTSLNYLYRAKDLAEGRQAYKQVIESLQGISELHNKKGDYKAALEAQKEAYQLADKYFYKEMSKQVNNLQADYELSKSRAKVQELRFMNNRQVLERRIILAVAVGALLVLAFIAYSDYRNRILNKKLVNANKNLDESNQVKDKLFSILGHDLRSPFVSVINMLELIDDEDLPASTRQAMINELGITSKAALETLTGLLKWGEMQIKGLRLNTLQFAVKPVLDRVMLLLNGTANFKHIEISNLVDEDVELIADPDHVEFVIRNLLSNAIKFTGVGGSIFIKCFFNNRNNEVTITVEDTGVGIAPDRVNSIFSLSNISSNGTYNEKGTSLGLMICKEFIEANGGSISVRSTLGVGSAFSFTLKGVVSPPNIEEVKKLQSKHQV